MRFEPTAKTWRIAFGLATTSDKAHTPKLKAVKINGMDVTNALKKKPVELPTMKIDGVTHEMLAKHSCNT